MHHSVDDKMFRPDVSEASSAPSDTAFHSMLMSRRAISEGVKTQPEKLKDSEDFELKPGESYTFKTNQKLQINSPFKIESALKIQGEIHVQIKANQQDDIKIWVPVKQIHKVSSNDSQVLTKNLKRTDYHNLDPDFKEQFKDRLLTGREGDRVVILSDTKVPQVLKVRNLTDGEWGYVPEKMFDAAVQKNQLKPKPSKRPTIKTGKSTGRGLEKIEEHYWYKSGINRTEAESKLRIVVSEVNRYSKSFS